MKSATRTVLSTTLTDVAGYSSGPLDVGDLYELAIDCHTTSTSPPEVQVSRIGADGNLYILGTFSLVSNGNASMDLGAGLSSARSFGDQVQLDLLPASTSVTMTISMKGK